jgi:hypothetical protein
MGIFSDVGNAVASAASAVGKAAEAAGKAVADGVEDAADSAVDGAKRIVETANEAICKNTGKVACGVANVIGGAVVGILTGVQDILDDVFNIVRDVFSIVGSLLSLDLPGLIEDIGQLVADILELGVAVVRLATGGYVVGGVVKQFRRSSLIRFVGNLVDRTYSDPQRTTVRRNIGLEGKRFGLRMEAHHRVMVLDSDTVDLWQLHEAGEIDLYALAGVLSFDSFSLGFEHPNAVVRLVDGAGDDLPVPVTRASIARHIESKGQANRLRVYPMDHRTVVYRVETATEKLNQIGVVLGWNEGRRLGGFRDETRYVLDAGDMYEFRSNNLDDLLRNPPYGYPRHDDCRIHAVAGFTFPKSYGRMKGVHLAGCAKFPLSGGPTIPARTDKCDARVINTSNPADSTEPSGVIYRDVYPSNVFKYVLPHEIGHYFGLCHCGHDGVQNVMFQFEANDFADPGLLDFYWSSEPHFTLEDGKNAWRFIVNEMPDCIE